MNFSFANLANVKELERLAKKYRENPASLDPSFQYFFEGVCFGEEAPSRASGDSDDLRIYLLIEAYRKFGHLKVDCNPIATTPLKEPFQLELKSLHFQEAELSKLFSTRGILKEKTAPLKRILERLEEIYCGKIGFEYKDLNHLELESFIQKEVEGNFCALTLEEKMQILHELTKAEGFETFLHTKFVGQKRFSLEGGETLIPLLSCILAESKKEGIESAVLGMAHRGRLNVLVNLLGKAYSEIFFEFEGHYAPGDLEGTGDVKYHKGFQGLCKTSFGQMPIFLAPNPSHLESVNPVVEGIARARLEDKGKKASVPILIHGDASLAGQGVVYETLQFSKLNGYGTQGTIHIALNNQIGFTTLPKDGRSTRYCTDIAKTFSAPVFHVNAEDPIGCIRVAKLAVLIRDKFGCDVFIDLNCYRKYGHNESDEPSFTQPLEYALIAKKKSIRTLYAEELVRQNLTTVEEVQRLEHTFKEALKTSFETPFSKQEKKSSAHAYLALSTLKTGVAQEKLKAVSVAMTRVPPEMRIHPKIERLLKQRVQMLAQDPALKTIDWGCAEMLAYGSLVEEKVPVRISGQDVRRGTFSHRQAFLVDQVQEKRYCPLSHLSNTQAIFEIYNSPLSEYAVLGFELGYSLERASGITIWEAQFGDFSNGAQIMIDQYIASCEQKWDVQTNLALFLPHGYEGQGPEHSSARIERYLQLAAQNNLRICSLSTPAQIFHLIRAQALLTDKRPLILFSPKAFLRHPDCLSSLKELSEGSFQEVLEEENPNLNPQKLIVCSGKIFYELLEEKKKRNSSHSLIRIEQFYPFPSEALSKVFSRYQAERVVFVQEEPANMGAFVFLKPELEALLKKEIHYIGREKSAAPSAGSFALHQKQQSRLINEVFDDN